MITRIICCNMSGEKQLASKQRMNILVLGFVPIFKIQNIGRKYTGMMNGTLCSFTVNLMQFSAVNAKKISGKQLTRLVKLLKELHVDITGSKDIAQAQVCAGGVDTREIEAASMMSKLVPGLFFAGEVVDIDGTCGGYNLQWAWSSGYVAGLHAAEYSHHGKESHRKKRGSNDKN